MDEAPARHVAELQAQVSVLSAELDVLRRAVEEASRVMRGIATEMRGPVQDIIGMTDLLLAAGLTGQQREYVEVVRASSQTLRAFTADVVTHEQLGSSGLILDTRPFEIRACAEGAIGRAAPDAASKPIELVYRPHDGLPPRIIGDGARVEQILAVWLRNAIRRTAQGRIEMSASRTENSERAPEVTFEISDNGAAIPEELLAVLFEPFPAVATSVTRNGGTSGLELSVAKRLADLMGGKLAVSSDEASGTRMSLTIAAIIPADDALRAAGSGSQSVGSGRGQNVFVTRPSRPPPPDGDKPAMRVLLVEDNVINQRVGAMVLSRLGYHPDVVANGLEAVEAVRKQPYDIVFMDLYMPELDGLEATRRIRRLSGPSRTPHIVAMTAAAHPRDRADCIEAGMDDFIPKPLRIEDVRDAIRRLEGASRERQAGPPSMPAISVSALERLREMARESGDGLLQELIVLFLQNAPQQISELTDHLARSEMPAVRSIAYSIKGSAVELGAFRMVRLCQQVDQAASEGRAAALPELLAQLRSELDLVRSALSAEVHA